MKKTGMSPDIDIKDITYAYWFTFGFSAMALYVFLATALYGFDSTFHLQLARLDHSPGKRVLEGTPRTVSACLRTAVHSNRDWRFFGRKIGVTAALSSLSAAVMKSAAKIMRVLFYMT